MPTAIALTRSMPVRWQSVVSGFLGAVAFGGRPGDPIDRFRSLLIARFDPVNGGFGSAPKLPHPYALLFALSLAGEGDSELAVAADTLHRMRALWDPASGGFYRYADGADWSRPGR